MMELARKAAMWHPDHFTLLATQIVPVHRGPSDACSFVKQLCSSPAHAAYHKHKNSHAGSALSSPALHTRGGKLAAQEIPQAGGVQDHLLPKLLSNCYCFNEDDYALMSLGSWINVVVGKMTGIDRSLKHVIVSKERKVPYDYLILCTGQQFQVPCPTGADISKLLTNREVSKDSGQRYTGAVPSNLFVICDDEDALVAMKWLREKVTYSTGNVIVYGNTIDTYTTVESLLSLGINGGRIHLVHPPLCSNVTALNNNAIERAVQKALAKAGVTVHHESLLAQWNDGSHPDPITSASFTTSTKPFKLQCSAFFSFTHKSVDYDTFKAVNDACLVYDGRLVIDTNFHTNDVAIRAAGPLTKFSNIYYANEWTHSNFSSKEIGFQLAAAMLSLFDLTLEPVLEPPEDMDRLIPMYKGCKVQGGVLPEKYNYVHIFKPGIPTRLDVQETQPNYGIAITTGDAVKGNYFRIHVNQYSMIETITCFSKKHIPVSNYICFFGQHERLLNNLCSRWREGLITNLYSLGVPFSHLCEARRAIASYQLHWLASVCARLFCRKFADYKSPRDEWAALNNNKQK
ncbi:Cilia- and flagella-associated protein 61 [Varanus komodoensis]|nr:Cilia- and flagella-associated protein 61 [Varanus komodoensis]